jgi:hypothetical protein
MWRRANGHARNESGAFPLGGLAVAVHLSLRLKRFHSKIVISPGRRRSSLHHLDQELMEDESIKHTPNPAVDNKMETQVHEKWDANYATRISPFERLPVEILSEIVEICVSYYEEITTIMHICCRLRHVTLGLPSIWCSIEILSPDNRWGPSYGYSSVCGIYLWYWYCSPFLLTEQ